MNCRAHGRLTGLVEPSSEANTTIGVAKVFSECSHILSNECQSAIFEEKSSSQPKWAINKIDRIACFTKGIFVIYNRN